MHKKPELSSRMRKIKEEILDSPVYVDTERVRVLLDSYKETDGLFPAQRRAAYFEQYLAEKTISIDDNPIVGDFGKYKVSAMPWIEISCRWMTKNLENHRLHNTMGEYVLDDNARQDIREAVEVWGDRCAYSRARTLFEEATGLDWATMGKTGMYIDGCGLPLPSVICTEPAQMAVKGLRSQLEKIEAREKTLPPIGTVETIKQRELLRAMRISLNAVINWSHRYAALAREMARSEKSLSRKKELSRIAEILERVPEHPARSFHEGIQSTLMIYMASVIEMSCPAGLAIGNISRPLNPLYLKDRDEGKITEEGAIELIQGFFAKVMGATIYASNVWSTAGQGFNACRISMGGYTAKGDDGTTELDYLLVEAQRQMKVIEPGLACFYTDKMPEDFLLKCMELLRDSGLGQPQFHNTDKTIERWLYNCPGVSLEDARERTVLGSCVVSVLGNLTNPPWEGAFNVAKMLELAMNNGVDPCTRNKVGIETGDPESFTTYRELHNAVRKQLTYLLEQCRFFDSTGFAMQAEILPQTFTSALIDHCIESATDLGEGGQPYGEMGTIIVGNIDLANSLAAIKKLVYDDKAISMRQLRKALEADFKSEEHAYIQTLCLQAPKYGNDDRYVDDIAREWFDIFYEEATKQPDCMGKPSVPEAYSHSLHWHTGARTMALPSGRKSGLALCDGSVSAQAGTDVSGPTALARSAARVLDTVKYSSNHLNMKFHPAVFKDDDGIRKVIALVKSYFDLGGYHIQFNCISDEMLVDAQRHPERYKNLTVRVAGFSAYFVRLDKGIQDEIIRRTMLNFQN
ncbi:MAG: pyruvate formate lyase family protein [Candidatus Omnitrophica bacterium]|nr:pyruvate formate lyase family protein [Candidatus Omnitrophota bacterium]